MTSHCIGLVTFIGFSVLILNGHMTKAEERLNIDLRGDGCDKRSGYYIGDDTLASVHHGATFNTISTRDDCTVVLRTDEGRRLEFIINDARFEMCGITITIYDSIQSNSDPKAIVDCETRPGLRGKSNYNVLRIHIRKSTVSTDNFQFSMLAINDRGPNIEFRGDEANKDQMDALEPGVIVGICIAGVIIIIALVLLAIYMCFRARQDFAKNDSRDHQDRGESSVYTSGGSQHLFSNNRYPKRRYGSTEDVRSTTSSKEKTNGAYSNTAYSADPVEKKSNRSNSLGRSHGKTGFTNDGYYQDQMDIRQGDTAWQEGDDFEVRIGSFRKSRIDSFRQEKKLKSAMKKRDTPSDIEMSKVNTQPVNSILKKNRMKSPNRSQTSSTDGGSLDAALVYGYKKSTMEHPNVQHKPTIEHRRSRSGSRSNRSVSSGGHSSRRAHSADRKPKPKPGNTGRMYNEIFISDFDRNRRPRSSSRNRGRSRSNRGSDSVDSESSVTSSKRVSMNPGGKRVHIKGEETDI